jgi:hypothetical protein
MPQVVRAFPLRSSRAALESFAAQLNGQRSADASQFYSTLWRYSRIVALARHAERTLGYRRY